MYLIVVGAEVEGQRFIDMAADDHRITLIETNKDKARRVLQKHDLRVLEGTIVDDDILAEAEIDQVDAMVAITYDDSQNLMAMVLAKEHGIETRIALVNHPSHHQLFEKIGAQVVSDPAGIIARQLYDCLA